MFNCVGRYDSAVIGALTEIERKEREVRRVAAYRPLVYVYSPYSGDVERKTARTRAFYST